MMAFVWEIETSPCPLFQLLTQSSWKSIPQNFVKTFHYSPIRKGRTLPILQVLIQKFNFFLFHLHTNLAKMMGLHEWDSIYMTIMSKTFLTTRLTYTWPS